MCLCVVGERKYNGTRRSGKNGMPLTISDKMLQDAGMTAEDARVEVACRLYAADKLTLRGGMEWAALTRAEFEAELLRRGIPIVKPTVDELSADLAALNRLGL